MKRKMKMVMAGVLIAVVFMCGCVDNNGGDDADANGFVHLYINTDTVNTHEEGGIRTVSGQIKNAGTAYSGEGYVWIQASYTCKGRGGGTYVNWNRKHYFERLPPLSAFNFSVSGKMPPTPSCDFGSPRLEHMIYVYTPEERCRMSCEKGWSNCRYAS